MELYYTFKAFQCQVLQGVLIEIQNSLSDNNSRLDNSSLLDNDYLLGNNSLSLTSSTKRSDQV